MAAPADDVRDSLEQLLLAGLGAVSLTAGRVEELVDSLAERGGLRRDDASAAVNELLARWRGDASRVTERAGAGLQGALRELGLVLRSELDELELRVAQLEHRLQLVEREDEDLVAPPPPPQH
jgi:polyhydroxyalkanoate synthesis regulator phasin